MDKGIISFPNVKSINERINLAIKSDNILSRVFMIKGELSNCNYRGNDIFFTLKDNTGVITGVMWGYRDRGLTTILKSGMSVIVTGSIGVWTNKGEYKIYANTIIPEGVGALYIEFERLKMKLNEEGLFDPDLKKPLPKYPRRIGIVSSTKADGLKDFITIVHKMNPYVELVLYDSLVQGKGAAANIVRGIEVLDGMGLDTIVIGRGGGSIEDLWAFNEEIVVRAVYNARTPVVSAVGHENDIVLTDYAADFRASTPSHAAANVVVDINMVLDGLEQTKTGLYSKISRKLEVAGLKLDNYQARLESLNPSNKLSRQSKELDGLAARMKTAMDNRLLRMKYSLDTYDTRLSSYNPIIKLEHRKSHLESISVMLTQSMNKIYANNVHRLELLNARLNGLSPTAKLAKGFGYVEVEGKTLTTVKNVNVGDKLSITVSDGVIHTIVKDIHSKEN